MNISQAPRVIAIIRLGYGLLITLAPKLASRVVGFENKELSPTARGWSLVAATREMGVGAMTLAVDDAPASTKRKAYLAAGAIDAGDAIAAVALSRKYPHMKAVLWMLVPAAVGSAVAHWIAAFTAE